MYGQGNFLFDKADNEFWQTSVLISVDIDNDGIQYIPILKDDNGVKLADAIEAKRNF